jgi:hypothetical protein
MKWCWHCHKHVIYNELTLKVEDTIERTFYCQDCENWIETIIEPIITI